MKEENNLLETVLSLTDYEEAASALIELKYINRQKAGKLALDILEKGKGDVHFQAGAFEVLYSVDQLKAFEFIKEKRDSVDVIVLRSMLECVTEDSSLIDDNPEMLDIVRVLNTNVEQLSADDMEKIGDTLDWFKETFSKQEEPKNKSQIFHTPLTPLKRGIAQQA
jgi:hypothetical protein